MKVVIINPMLYTAPLKGRAIKKIDSIKDTMIVNFCKGFVKNGHTVTLIASNEYRPLIEEDFGFEIVYLENWVTKYIPKFPHGLPLLAGLKKYLKNNQENYDLVISSELFTFHSITAAKVCPEKLIVWQEFGHHHIFFKEIPSKIWHNTVVRYYIKNKVVIVARSTVARKFVKQYCNKVSNEVINNSVDFDKFVFSREKENYLIIVSRLVPGKNISTIIDKYIAYDKKYNQGLSLYIIGDGPERQKLESKVTESGYGEKIKFLGRMQQDKFAEMLAKAKGFLCDTIRELNMISMTEAIVSGTPILTNCVPHQHELVNLKKLGIAKEHWNEDDISNLIENNNLYVDNCIAQRDFLSNVYLSNKMIEIFKQYR
ncbi:MAG: glycosyltransferase [Muribaculaceae bacterium]